MSQDRFIRIVTSVLALFMLTLLGMSEGYAQGALDRPSPNIPSPLAISPTNQQQSALQKKTSAQEAQVLSLIRPRLLQAIQNHNAPNGAFRGWKSILSKSGQTSDAIVNSSSTNNQLHFLNSSGAELLVTPIIREYHPNTATSSSAKGAAASMSLGALQPALTVARVYDQDGDGLTDTVAPGLFRAFDGGLESALASDFMPSYYLSIGEQQSFATFGNYVPWTVTSLVGTNPPNGYYHVTPLGLATDSSGNQLYAIRIDYLSLWNADGGMIGGGAACFYSYFGLDSVIQELSGHSLDAERSVMLVAAPAVNGGINTDDKQYSIYSIYTAAHEGTFFDQSEYFDFTTPVPAPNHVELTQSLSKHSTYGFNPDYYPITPAWFIAATNEGITVEWLDGDIDDATYALLLAAADDTFFGCLVERFGDQGGQSPNPTLNVGEVTHPLNASGFIQDNSDAALHLASKLTDSVF